MTDRAGGWELRRARRPDPRHGAVADYSYLAGAGDEFVKTDPGNAAAYADGTQRLTCGPCLPEELSNGLTSQPDRTIAG